MKKDEILARWVLDNFTPKSISQGVAVERIVKYGKKAYKDTYVLILGTKTPIYIIKKWKQTKKLTKQAIKLLSNFYKRFQYNQLLAVGCSYNEARRFRGKLPEIVKQIRNDYLSYVDRIYQFRKKEDKSVQRKYIIMGMMKSSTLYKDWEYRLDTSPRTKKSKRKLSTTLSEYKDYD